VLFVGTAIGNIRITDALRSIWPFYIAALVVTMLVAYLPGLSLWLPAALK
jgi:TRAP-type C4-dicarboxylate transport system permease large subunit